MTFKRTRLKEPKETGDIEQRIIIGMITNNEYMKEITKIDNPVQYLESSTARIIGNWCVEYFKKYNKIIGRDMDGMFFERMTAGKLNKDLAEELEEEILPQLSDKSVNEPMSKFLLDQTVSYFQHRQATIFNENLEVALANRDMNEFGRLRETFKPISLESNNGQLKTSDIYNKEYGEMDWLIKDLLPKGLTVFAGKSKTGKSYLMLNIMMKLAQNDWMFADTSASGFHGKRGHILYLALEDTERRLAIRMRGINADPKVRVLDKYLELRLTWPKFFNGGLSKIEQWIQEKTKPILIVIDVIERIAPKSSKTSAGRYYSEEYGIFGPISDLAHKYNTSIIVITHSTKNKASDVFDEILGGAGTAGPADNLMVLAKDPKDPNNRVLSIRGKDIDEKQLLFEVTGEGAEWFCLGDTWENRMTEERQSIYDYLEENGAMSYTEIEQAARDGLINVSVSSVKLILRKMRNDGKLEQKQLRGKYDIKGSSQQSGNSGHIDHPSPF